MVQLVKKVTESTKMGKSKKSKTSAVEAPISPVITKKNKKAKKNKNLETAAKMVKSEEIAAKVETTTPSSPQKSKKKNKKAAMKVVEPEEDAQSESEEAPMSEEEAPMSEEEAPMSEEEAASEPEPASPEKQTKKSNKRKSQSDGETVEPKSKKAREEFSVFVGHLNQRVTTAGNLRTAFSKFGNVTDVFVPKSQDRYNKNKGFCFVKFDSQESADKAIASNGSVTVDEVVVAINESKKKIEGDAGKSKDEDLFVAKLSTETTKEDIEEYFGQFGALKNVSLPQADGKHKGYAFVAFMEKTGSDAALAQTQHEINSNAIVLRPPKGQVANGKAAQNAKTASSSTELFVAKLSSVTTRDTLKAHFSKYGSISNISIPFDRVKQCTKSFAFITFLNEESVTAAIAEDHEIDDHKVAVNRKQSKTENVKRDVPQFDNEIFIGGVDKQTTKDTIEEHFSAYGTLTNITFPKTPKGDSKGYCFVAFEDDTSLEKAMAAEHKIDGRILSPRPKKEAGGKVAAKPVQKPQETAEEEDESEDEEMEGDDDSEGEVEGEEEDDSEGEEEDGGEEEGSDDDDSDAEVSGDDGGCGDDNEEGDDE